MNREEKQKLLGKHAILKEDILRPEFQNIPGRVVLVGGGTFNPEKWLDKENVCTLAVDGHVQCWDWDDILRLATEDEIERANSK